MKQGLHILRRRQSRQKRTAFLLLAVFLCECLFCLPLHAHHAHTHGHWALDALGSAEAECVCHHVHGPNGEHLPLSDDSSSTLPDCPDAPQPSGDDHQHDDHLHEHAFRPSQAVSCVLAPHSLEVAGLAALRSVERKLGSTHPLSLPPLPLVRRSVVLLT